MRRLFLPPQRAARSPARARAAGHPGGRQREQARPCLTLPPRVGKFAKAPSDALHPLVCEKNSPISLEVPKCRRR